MSSNGDPTHLYKYRSLKGCDAKERIRQTITNSTIWFSSPADFNDPFDCSPVYSMQASKADRRKYLASLLSANMENMPRNERRIRQLQLVRDLEQRMNSPQFLPNWREITARSIKSVGVLSLSALPDQVLMWSHYAEAHTGICLRFAPWAYPISAAQKVIYSAERPVLNPIKDDADALVNKSILTKACFWAHEEEWRVMSHPGSPISESGPGLTTFEPKALDGIILGARISDDDAAAVAQWVEGREHPIEILRARPDADRFRINIVPLAAPLDNERTIEISGSE